MIRYIEGKPMLQHECIRCGKCCKYRQGVEGIFLTPWDILRIARHLNLSCEQMIAKYCEPIGDVEYVLKSIGKECDCVFLKKNADGTTKCEIYPVRCLACYMFPLGKGEGRGEIVVNPDPFAKEEVDPVDIAEFIAKSSQGQYMEDCMRTDLHVAVITKFLSTPHTLEECKKFRKYWFINQSIDQLNEKLRKELAK